MRSRKLSSITCLAGLGVAAALVTALVVPAQATTWSSGRTSTVKAPDYDRYRATIGAVGYGLPKGDVDAGSTETVLDSRHKTMAANVARYRARAGTYTVYTTARYRTKKLAWAYIWTGVTVADTDDHNRVIGTTCTITAVTPGTPYITATEPAGGTPVTNDWSIDVQYSLICPITRVDRHGHVHTVEPTTTVKQTLGPQPVPVGSEPVFVYDKVGDLLFYPSYIGGIVWFWDQFSYWSYGPVVVKRTEHVVKVVDVNTMFITLAEWTSLKTGMTRARVATIFGNAGHRHSTSGSKVVWAYTSIKNGSVDGTYYLTFRNDRLYSWSRSQWH